MSKRYVLLTENRYIGIEAKSKNDLSMSIQQLPEDIYSQVLKTLNEDELKMLVNYKDIEEVSLESLNSYMSR
jgi:hypothetical protein